MKNFTPEENGKLMQIFNKCNNQEIFLLGSLPKEVEDFITKNGNKITTKENDKKFDLVVSIFGFGGSNEDQINKVIMNLMNKLKVGGKFVFVEQCARYTDTKVEGLMIASALTNCVTSKHMKVGNKVFCFEIEQQFGFNQNYQDSNTAEKSCWVFHLTERIVEDGRKDYTTFQQYLDQSRYSYTHILRYERIFGKDFVSTGGIGTTQEVCEKIKVKPGERILDVGCGIGGSAFHFVQKYKGSVVGFDLSENMIEIARNRNKDYRIPNIEFLVADALKIDYEANSFDVVYSRDTILHIPPKKLLFSQFYKWLKPGGRLLITDYCCGPYEKHSPDFKSYVAERGYTMLTVDDYAQVLNDVGFKQVQGVDKTEHFLTILKSELETFEGEKDDFIKKFSEKDYKDISEGWKDKLERSKYGDQRWGLFIAQK